MIIYYMVGGKYEGRSALQIKNKFFFIRVGAKLMGRSLYEKHKKK